MEEKLVFIREYLAKKFAGCDIEHREDFIRSSQSFKIYASGGPLLLKVSDEFIDDNPIEEIDRLFDLFGIPGVLAENTELGVMLTQQGIGFFNRD